MTKRTVVYIVAGIGILAAYFILINLKRVAGIFSYVGDILRPFIIAAIFAYFINGPMMFFERHFTFADKKKPDAKACSCNNCRMDFRHCGVLSFFCNYLPGHKDKCSYPC